MGAAEKDSKVEDFEVGVFSGKYVTGVPEGYFEHLSLLRQGKKRKASAAGLTVVGPTESSEDPVVITSSGPVNVPGPDDQEDIRSVPADNTLWLLLTCHSLPASTTLPSGIPCMKDSLLGGVQTSRNNGGEGILFILER